MLEDDLFVHMSDSVEEDDNYPDEEVYSARDFLDDDLDNVKIEFQRSAVTAINQCPTFNAKKLCIFNLDYKLQHSDHYDIGGTYNKRNPNLWFYCTTSGCPGGNYILNIFVCHRNTGSFKISICNLDTLIEMKDVGTFSNYVLMPKKMTSKTFTSSQVDKNYFIKTFCFSKEVVDNLHKILTIPIEIELEPKCPVDKDFLKNIKLKHCLAGVFKRDENTDFTLITKSGKKYDIHTALITTHSHVLKGIIYTSGSKSAFVDMNDDEIEILLDFLYMGGSDTETLDDHCFKLLNVAYRFKLGHVILLKQAEIIKKLTINNAVDLAVLTEKYNLPYIQEPVFDFIKENPEVFETEGWKNLNDVALTKKLFQICKQKK